MEQPEKEAQEPLASGSGATSGHIDYGSTDTAVNEADSISAESWIERMSAWGHPPLLVATTWGALLPILAPIIFIGMQNTSKEYFVGRCTVMFPQLGIGRAYCDLTLIGAVVFCPVVGPLAMGLVSWRLLKQRLFYSFLQRRIFIVFDQNMTFARTVVGCIFVLWVLAVLHCCLILVFGYPIACKNPEHCQRYIPDGGSLSEIISNPKILQTPPYLDFYLFQKQVIRGLACPGILAVYFAYNVRSANSILVPLGHVLDAGPKQFYQVLGDSITLNEDVAKEILTDAALPFEEQDNNTAAETFRQAALSYDGVVRIGCDEESVPPRPLKGVTPEPSVTLGQFLLKVIHLDLGKDSWWPLRIVLKDDDFRKAWLFHCFVSFWFIGLAFRNRSLGLFRTIERMNGIDPHLGHGDATLGECSSGYLRFILGILLLIFLLQILVALVRQIYNSAFPKASTMQ